MEDEAMSAKELFGVIVRTAGLVAILFGLYELWGAKSLRQVFGGNVSLFGMSVSDISSSGGAASDSMFGELARAAASLGISSLIVGVFLLIGAPLVTYLCYWSIPRKDHADARVQ